ncbi:MAG: PLP-dependent lyase/thiolase [Sphingobacteriales bacterium]|nr:PLP-dependent lyase/thiolase [Sphingobacteriales bacterium]
MVNRLLEVDTKELRVSLPGNTPIKELHHSFGVCSLFVKDESKNPTHTFKDRLAYEMLQPIINDIEAGRVIKKTTFGSISYGNTALSLGYYCKQLNEEFGEEIVNAIAFIPPALKSKVFGPDTSGKILRASEVLKRVNENCELIEIDLSEKLYRAKDLEILARKSGVCLENFLDVTEGLNRPAYEAIISEAIEKQLKNIPDYVIVPFGAGILCNEIVDYIKDHSLKTKVIPVSSGSPDTLAIMLYGPIWVDTKGLVSKGIGLTTHDKIDLKGREREPYYVYQVNDDEIVSALQTLKQLNISCEPSGASGFAILPRLKEISPEFNPDIHSVLVINTGNSFLNF